LNIAAAAIGFSAALRFSSPFATLFR